MRVDALEDAIQDDAISGFAPFLVVSMYGTTNSGAIDDTRASKALSQQYACWVHVDAAWGGAYAAFLPQLCAQEAFAGADSISVHAHKALSVSMSAGMLFLRNRGELTSTFSTEADYMPQAGQVPDSYLRSVQWSRRLIGLKLYMTLAELGEVGYREILERGYESVAICRIV